MIKINIKTFLLYLMLIIYIVFSELIIPSTFIEQYNMIVNPLCWIIMSIVAYFLTIDVRPRYKDRINKTQTVVILIIIYSMIHFALGLFFTYGRSPYSHTFIGITKNLWCFVSILFLQEYVRNKIANSGGVKHHRYIFVTFLFILIEMNFRDMSTYFVSGESTFKYICATLLPLIGKNMLLTYLTTTGGYICALFYKIPFALLLYLLPIMPNVDWFIEAIASLLFMYVIFIVINYIHKKKTERISTKSIKKVSPTHYVPIIVFLIIFVSFMIGLFKYYPVAILSNSMLPVISRGDAVIVEKISQDDMDIIQVGDIIQYQLTHSYVVHRVVSIQKENGLYVYTTKGDNNNAEDDKKVKQSQVIGIVKLKIPKIGFPSVWFSEIFKNNTAEVET